MQDVLKEREKVKVANYNTNKEHKLLYPNNSVEGEEVKDGPDEGFCETAFMRLKRS